MKATLFKVVWTLFGNVIEPSSSNIEKHMRMQIKFHCGNYG